MKRAVFLFCAVLIAITSAELAHSRISEHAKQRAEATEFFKKFLHTWLVDQNIGEVYAAIHQTKEMAQDVRNMFGLSSRHTFDYDLWLQKTLTMWLLQNHGEIDAYGHGNPFAGSYADLATRPTNINDRIRPKVISEVLEFRSFEHPNIAPLNEIFKVQLFHAPEDEIYFGLTKVNGQWRITAYFWFSYHPRAPQI